MVLMDEKVAQLLLRKKANMSSMVLEITAGSHVVPEEILEVVVVYISLQRLRRLCAWRKLANIKKNKQSFNIALM